jgi:prepilin-type N-terminal cleavage/methylation domain-containing protein
MISVNKKNKHHGFSLVELAIVMLIVTLLLGGLLVPLNAQIDQQRTKETLKTLAELKETLIGFAIVNGRLPCPAAPNTTTGLESYTGAVGTSACTNPFDGLLPAATLGITPINSNGLLLDGWNNPIHYAVSNKTIGSQTNALITTNGIKNATLNSLSAPTLTLLYVCASTPAPATTNCGTATVLTDKAPALVFSLGKNGNRGSLGPDQTANVNTPADPIFVSHTQSSDGAGNEEFDDIVEWLSTGILINRLVSAGQLP